MKKFSIVLLALLLAGGFAFAAELALDGEVTSSFGMDLDLEQYGFDLDESQEMSLTFSASASSEGEGDVYGVISITDAELVFDTALPWTFDLGSLEAKIVGPEWEVILGSPTSLGNAASPDMDGDDNDSEDAVDPSGFANGGNGLTVNYSDITVGFDFFYDNLASTLDYLAYVGYGTELADGIDADVAFAVTNGDFAGTVALAYAMDDMTVDAALDMEYDGTLDFDASASTSYTMGDVTASVAGYYESVNGHIDVFVSADYTGVEDVTVGLWAYINDGFNDDLVPTYSDEELYALEAALDLSYELDDVFTPYASLGYAYSKSTTTSLVPVEVGVKAALIDNASAKLNYVSDDVLDFSNNLGKVTASVTVSF